MNVGELVAHPVVTCHVNDTLANAAQLMWDHDCGAIAVVHDDGTLAGMITDRDICIATHTQGRPPADLLVNLAMSKQVFATHADRNVSEVEHLMAAHQVRRIPVVDAGNRPIGIVTINDLVREAIAPASRLRHGRDRVLTALAAIGRSAAERSQRAA